MTAESVRPDPDGSQSVPFLDRGNLFFLAVSPPQIQFVPAIQEEDRLAALCSGDLLVKIGFDGPAVQMGYARDLFIRAMAVVQQLAIP